MRKYLLLTGILFLSPEPFMQVADDALPRGDNQDQRTGMTGEREETKFPERNSISNLPVDPLKQEADTVKTTNRQDAARKEAEKPSKRQLIRKYGRTAGKNIHAHKIWIGMPVKWCWKAGVCLT